MLQPNAAFALLSAGVGGCVFELIQPGRIAPGVFGLGSAVVGAYDLWRNHPTPAGLTFIGLALFLLTAAYSKLYLAGGAAASISLSTGFILLFPAPPRIAPILVIPVCTGFCFYIAWLLHTAILVHLRKRERS